MTELATKTLPGNLPVLLLVHKVEEERDKKDMNTTEDNEKFHT